MMTRVLVTGGGGFIGSHLAEFVVAPTLAGALALGTLAAAATDPAKVESKLTINFDRGSGSDSADPYAQSSFEGKVKPKDATKSQPRKCRKGRTVVVRQTAVGDVGSDKTNRRGRYGVPAGHVMDPGEYEEFSSFFAKVKKKEKGNVICEKAKSPIIIAP